MTVYYENNEWHLSKYKVNYTDENKPLENTVGKEGKSWWTELAKNSTSIADVTFTNVTLTEEEKARIEQVNQLRVPDGFTSTVSLYVKEGRFPERPDHALKDLEYRVVSKELELNQNMTNMETLNILGSAMGEITLEQANQYMEITSLIAQL